MKDKQTITTVRIPTAWKKHLLELHTAHHSKPNLSAIIREIVGEHLKKKGVEIQDRVYE